jgi:hypothetical protein
VLSSGERPRILSDNVVKKRGEEKRFSHPGFGEEVITWIVKTDTD